MTEAHAWQRRLAEGSCEQRSGTGEVLHDAAALEHYARDRSPFRITPAAAARPCDAGQVAALVAMATSLGLPITARGGGSSVAGQCLGEGLICDLSQMDWIEPLGDRVRCGPGAVLDEVNRRLAPLGRRLGPEATSASIACIGGLIATNACGARSRRYGRFGDALTGATVVLADGSIEALRPGAVPERLGSDLAELRPRAKEAIADWPVQPRSFGGYRLDDFSRTGDALSLVPGSEGTLALVTEVELETVVLPADRVFETVGCAGVEAALELAPQLADRGAVAAELLDWRLIEAARRGGLGIPASSESKALLLVEYEREPDRFLSRRLTEAEAQAAWRLRHEALYLLTRGGRAPFAVFEDPAVRPERAAGFYHRLTALLERLELYPTVYGHALAGCLHVRPICDPRDPTLRAQLEQALPRVAELVVEFGGALTGEHGWGLARSHLVPSAVGRQAHEVFTAVKQAFDPTNILNPGKIVGAQDPFGWFDPPR